MEQVWDLATKVKKNNFNKKVVEWSQGAKAEKKKCEGKNKDAGNYKTVCTLTKEVI